MQVYHEIFFSFSTRTLVFQTEIVIEPERVKKQMERLTNNAFIYGKINTMNELSITRSALNERLVLNDMAPET